MERMRGLFSFSLQEVFMEEGKEAEEEATRLLLSISNGKPKQAAASSSALPFIAPRRTCKPHFER